MDVASVPEIFTIPGVSCCACGEVNIAKLGYWRDDTICTGCVIFHGRNAVVNEYPLLKFSIAREKRPGFEIPFYFFFYTGLETPIPRTKKAQCDVVEIEAE